MPEKVDDDIDDDDDGDDISDEYLTWLDSDVLVVLLTIALLTPVCGLLTVYFA